MKQKLKIVLTMIMAILSAYIFYVIKTIDVLPLKYIILLVIGLIVLNVLGIIFLFKKGKYIKIVPIIMYLIITILFGICLTYGNDTINFLKSSFNNADEELTVYDVIVLKNSNYNKIEDLTNKYIGYIGMDINIESVQSSINEKVTSNFVDNEDLYSLYDNLLAYKMDAIVIDDAYLDVLADDYKDINDNIKIIYTIEIKDVKKTDNKVNELKPINIYISGSDSRSNNIVNKSRSDVNMILTINPYTKTVLMTSIPRDYYVQVHNTTGLKDKLTHAGIYGIDVSRQTLEDLFDIDIAYSIKIGMNAVTKLVDTVGGIDVYSDTKFNSYHKKGWVVEKGINHMDGEKALAYSRERYAYLTGDRHRILNQQQVLEETLKKIINDKNILNNYNNLLVSLSNLYRTDIPKEYVTMLIQNLLDTGGSYNFVSMSVSGSDASMNTYTAPNSKRYVMIPYEKDVNEATKKIKEVLKGE